MGLDSCAPLDISGAIYCKDFWLLHATSACICFGSEGQRDSRMDCDEVMY